jgi:hypothetical protein
MDYETFLKELVHEGTRLDRNPTQGSQGSYLQATITWLGWREAEDFRRAIAELLPTEDELGPQALAAIASVGHTREMNREPHERAVRIVLGLAHDQIEWTRKQKKVKK